MVSFPILPELMCGISCNKETFSVDVTGFPYAGKTCWGLVFNDIHLNILDFHRLGSKFPASTSNMYYLGQLIFEHGIPRNLITDSYSVFRCR